MANSIYNYYKGHALSGTIDVTSDQIQLALLSGTYDGSLNKNDISFANNVQAYEVVGGNYVAGGQMLANPAVELDLGTNRAYFTATDPSWSNATITASGAVVYRSGTAPADYLMAYIDFGGDQTSSNGTFQINFNNSRIFAIDEV